MEKEQLTGKRKLENELSELIEKVVIEQEKDVLKNSAKEIAAALIPQVEELVAKKVKQHLRQIGTFILEMTRDKEKSKDGVKKADSGSEDSKY